jgi:Protein of unknown function (DUF1524)/Excalibur calcium-binding domain
VMRLERSLLTLHLEDFPPATHRSVPLPEQPDVAASTAAREREVLEGVSVFNWTKRIQAKKWAAEAGLHDAQAQRHEDMRARDEQQLGVDDEWARLLAHDSDAVHGALEAAFEDNQSPAACVDVGEQDGMRFATILILFGSADLVPERRPDLTPTGRPTLRKRTKTERNDFYVQALGSTVLATVREAFAVAPSVTDIPVVVLKVDKDAADSERRLEWIYSAQFLRKETTALPWQSLNPAEVLPLVPYARMQRRGAAREVVGMPIADEPGIAKIVAAVSAADSGSEPPAGLAGLGNVAVTHPPAGAPTTQFDSPGSEIPKPYWQAPRETPPTQPRNSWAGTPTGNRMKSLAPYMRVLAGMFAGICLWLALTEVVNGDIGQTVTQLLFAAALGYLAVGQSIRVHRARVKAERDALAARADAGNAAFLAGDPAAFAPPPPLPEKPKMRRGVVTAAVIAAVVVLIGIIADLSVGLDDPSQARDHSAPPSPTSAPAAAPTQVRIDQEAAAPPLSSTTADSPPAQAADAQSSATLAKLATLAVKGRAPKTGYDRSRFGDAWTDDVTVADGHNGCDTRNDILRRDLIAVEIKPDSNGCAVLSGTLHDPYTDATVEFQRGDGSSSQVQIDHVVALSDAWQKGAQQWDAATLRNFANDPINLQATTASINQQKGDGDAATWLPPNNFYRCTYVSRIVDVKSAYGVWVTQAEHDAIARILSDCDTAASAPNPAETPTTVSVEAQPTDTPPPVLVPSAAAIDTPQFVPPPVEPTTVGSPAYYPNCKAAKAAGAAPLYAGQPGYRPGLDRDDDGVACE